MDDAVVARFVRDDNAELIVDETDWGVTYIDGAAAPTYALYTEDKASGNGVTVLGKQVKARDLQIDAATMSTTNNAPLRARVLEFFSPHRVYKVYLTYMGRTRWITGELQAFKAPNDRITKKQTFSVYFLCPGAYWQSVDDFGQDIAGEEPRWGFPYMDNPDYGALVSVFNFSRSVVFDYDGTVSAYPVYTLTATGTVRNPKIIKDDAYVRLLLTMEEGDVIRISTDPPRVTKDGQSILNKVDRTSRLTDMIMTPGSNTVKYEAEYGDNELHVVITYNKQYLGV